MKKYSLLGITLIAVSAVTAAFMPSKASTKSANLLGVIQPDLFDGNVTCTQFGSGQCDYSVTGVSSATLAGTATDDSTVVFDGTTI